MSNMRVEVESVRGTFWHIRYCFLEVEEEEYSKHYLSNDASLHRPMNIASIVTQSATKKYTKVALYYHVRG